ncbi:MAG TPA: 2'-5' RNA ligase family protein [Verrucomicrobiales bacterium]|nr:2'-5' RNA ligase family protein [Verrucomicrobiales bacterium]
MNRLFLAIFPDADAVQQISERTPGLRSSHRLTGRLRPADHFHITIHWFDDYVEIPGDVVQAAGEACESVTALTPAFEVSFDRVMSFRGSQGNCPFVMAGNDQPGTALMKFHAMLSKALLKHRCPGRARSHFKPHLTLLYDRQMVHETPVKPVAWTAREIVLVHSELGATRYHRLGHWKFRG